MCTAVLRQHSGDRRVLGIHALHADATEGCAPAMSHNLGGAVGWLPDDLLAHRHNDTDWLPHRDQPQASDQLAPWPRRFKSSLYEPQHTHIDARHHNGYYREGSHPRHSSSVADTQQLAHHDWLHDWDGFADHPRRAAPVIAAQPAYARHSYSARPQSNSNQAGHHAWAREAHAAAPPFLAGGRRHSWDKHAQENFARHAATDTKRSGAADEHDGQWLRASEQGFGGGAGLQRRRASWLGSDEARQQRPAHSSSEPAYPHSSPSSAFSHRGALPLYRDEPACYSPLGGTATLGDGLWESEQRTGDWGKERGTSSGGSSCSEQPDLHELELVLGQADREALPYLCSFPDCGQAFAHTGPLRSHELQHVGDTPYVCPQQPCPAAFATADALRTHLPTHMADRPYRCPVSQCTAAFRQSSGLKMHIRTHTGERPFKCSFVGCTSAFKRSSQLKLHKRIHTGEKPYVCSFDGCTARFSCPRNFSAHKRTHTGEKPYRCSFPTCDATFGRSSSLTRHMKVHTRSLLPQP